VPKVRTVGAGVVLIALLAVLQVLVYPAVAAHSAEAVQAKAVRNTGLAISPVFSRTLVGGFDQAGNTLLDCAALTSGAALPAGGCVRNINTALTNPGNLPFYNNQVIQKYVDRDANPNTYASSSATVTVPNGATVVFAELEWLGTSQASPNPNIVWNPLIWQQPMLMSVGDDQHYVSITPGQGTSIEPGTPASDTNDFYYSASADVTTYLAGRTGQITVWGANAPFPANGFNQAGLGWNIVVVYQYPTVDLGATPPQVGKQITVQVGFAYQQSTSGPTNTVVNVPAITDPDQVQVGLIAGEGDAGLTGDTFAVNGINITHPVTGQTNNFFVSYAQNATNPNWTSNFSTDNVSWTLASGIVHAGATGMTLTTTTSGDGYFLAGLNTAVPVPSVDLTKTVTPTYTTVGAQLTYTFTVTNTSAVPIHTLSVTDPLFGGDVPDCTRAGTLAPGASYTCTATHTITADDIAAGRIDNTATAHALGAGDEPLSNTASAETTTSTSLSITKTGSAAVVNVGDPFTYTITVTNQGPGDAANVTATDPLPSGLLNPTATATPGVTVGISGGTLTATLPLFSHLAPDNTFTVAVTGTISATAGNSITNTAQVEAPNTNCSPPGNDPVNCEDTDTAEVLPPAPISIVKETSNSTPKPGDTFLYTVQVRNESDTTTASATVSDPIPAPLVAGDWTCATTPSATPCSPASGTGDITNVALTLEPLDVATFTISVTVPADFQGGTLTNEAVATPGQHTECADDPSAVTCSAEVPITVTPDPAQLTVEKSHVPLNASPPPGSAITYTVTVTNTSTSTIAHGTFDDPVPAMINATGATWTTTTTGAGTTVTPASGTGFPTGQTIDLTIAPGGTVTFAISAAIADPYDGSNVTNIATVTPGTNTACEDGEPTCQAEDTFSLQARLLVEKSHAPVNPSPAPGQQSATPSPSPISAH
jgi:uncharacterized repeat protein (TIGR01451 family)